MVGCSIRVCRSRHQKGSGIQFFSFPKNSIAYEWLRYCGPRTTITNGRVCSKHFTLSDYKKPTLKHVLMKESPYTIRTLKPGAIPSLLIHDVEKTLHRFPNPNSINWEEQHRFKQWKSLLDKGTQEMGNDYIYTNLRLCGIHFNPIFKLPSHRLTRNAEPTLFLGCKNVSDGSKNKVTSSLEPIVEKCFKCGVTAGGAPARTLISFPKPSPENFKICEAWAKFCYPDSHECSFAKFQHKLYYGHVMLCDIHFKRADFIDFEAKTLRINAYPTIEVEATGAKPSPAHAVLDVSKGPDVDPLLITLTDIKPEEDDDVCDTPASPVDTTLDISPSVSGYTEAKPATTTMIAGKPSKMYMLPKTAVLQGLKNIDLSKAVVLKKVVNLDSVQKPVTYPGAAHKQQPINSTPDLSKTVVLKKVVNLDSVQKPVTYQQQPIKSTPENIQLAEALRQIETLKCIISEKDDRIKTLQTAREKRIYTLQVEILTLKAELKKLKSMPRTIERLKKRISVLKQDQTLSKVRERLLKDLSLPARAFILMQFFAKIKDRGRRYSTQAKIVSLAIFKASPACYKLLSKYFVLPSKRVLTQFTSEIRQALKQQANTDQSVEAEAGEAVSNLNEASEQVGDVATAVGNEAASEQVPEPRPEQVLRITGPTRLHLSDGSVAELAAGVVVELGDGDCVQLASGHVVQFAHGHLVEVNRFDLMQSNDIDDNQPDENVNTIANNETNVDQTEERKSQDTDFKLECDIESFEPPTISEAEVKLEKCAELKTQPIVDEFKIQNTTKTYQRKRPKVNETDSNGREIKKIIIQINDQTRPSTEVSSHQRKRPNVKVKESESNEREIKKIIIKVNDEQSGPLTDVSGVRGYDMPQLDRLMDLG